MGNALEIINRENKHQTTSPELERERFNGLLHYLEHGYPSPRVRWHHHEECELHLIVATTGKFFVGDYIGEFAPGQLVMTGPRLPHNWISTGGVPEGGISLRDMVLQFSRDPLVQASAIIPELREILPILEMASYGIEFLDCGAEAERRFMRLRETDGSQRFAEFVEFAGDLTRNAKYHLLSSVKLQSFESQAELAKINIVLNEIAENYCQPLSAEAFAGKLGMSLSKFSRFFLKATGNNFTDYVSRVRINKACQLLMNTDQYVTNVCYEVGFNNVANFNRRFLQVKGMTPKEFRKNANDRFGNSPSALRQ